MESVWKEAHNCAGLEYVLHMDSETLSPFLCFLNPLFPPCVEQKNEGHRCMSCSLQCRERRGMRWELMLCQFKLLADLLDLSYAVFISSKAVVSHCLWNLQSRQLRCKLLLKEACFFYTFTTTCVEGTAAGVRSCGSI